MIPFLKWQRKLRVRTTFIALLLTVPAVYGIVILYRMVFEPSTTKILASRVYTKNPLAYFSNSNTFLEVNLLIGIPDALVYFENPIDMELYDPYSYSVKNTGNKNEDFWVVVNDKDWSSNESIVESAFRDSSFLSDEKKVLVLFEFITNNVYWDKPPFKGRSELSTPVTLMNLTGYAYCNDLSYSLATLLEVAKIKSRVVFLNSEHVVIEAFYDDSWHMFDPSVGIFFRKVDGEVASVEDIFHDLSLLSQTTSIFGFSKDREEFLTKIYKKKIVDLYEYHEDFMGKNDIPNSFQITLRPKEEIRYYYDWKHDYYWFDYSDRPPQFTNGVLISEVSRNIFSSPKISKTFRLPYPILGSYIFSENICHKANLIQIAVDGENWEPIDSACTNDHLIDISRYFPKGPGTTIHHNYQLKFNIKSLKNAYVLTTFQVAPKSLPRLADKLNTIKLKINKPIKRINPLQVNFVFNKNI